MPKKMTKKKAAMKEAAIEKQNPPYKAHKKVMGNMKKKTGTGRKR